MLADGARAARSSLEGALEAGNKFKHWGFGAHLVSRPLPTLPPCMRRIAHAGGSACLHRGLWLLSVGRPPIPPFPACCKQSACPAARVAAHPPQPPQTAGTRSCKGHLCLLIPDAPHLLCLVFI